MWPHPPAGVSPAAYFIALSIAMLIIGIAKSGFGGGVGILAIPLIAAVLSPQAALGTILPLLIIADVFANLHYLRYRSAFHVKWLVYGALVGVVAGTAVFLALQHYSHDQGHSLAQVLYFVVGGMCFVLVAIQVYRLFGGKVPRIPGRPGPTAAVGMTAGFVSTLANAAGPIVNIYLLEQRMEKRLLIGTVATYAIIINTAKLPTYIYLHFTTWDTFLTSIWVLPLIPIGSFLGVWMQKRIDEKPFAAVLYVAAAVAAADLIAKGMGWYSIADLSLLWR